MTERTLYPGAYEIGLDNGLRIFVEEVPQSRSVSAGVWIRAGSRDDPPQFPGIAHFVEHLAFKGSATRDARAISHQIDAVGGHLNAATSKESTFYYADVPADGVETALELLADLTTHPRFAPADIELERNVVLEEIRGHEDDPEQTAYDLFSQGLWADDHPVARSVVGTRDAIASVSRDDVLAFHRTMYPPANMVLAVCGRVDVDRIVRLVQRHFTSPFGDGTAAARTPPVFQPVTVHYPRSTGMTHVYIGTPGPTAAHDDRIPLEIANSIVGDGTSSRLFHSVRESRGLAYVITSYVHSFSDGGVWLTYAGIAPRNQATVLELIRSEFETLLTNPIPQEELDLARAKLRGHLILGMETNSHRASRLANAALQDRPILSPDELLARLDGVTCDSVHEVLTKYLRLDRLHIATVGPAD